jgi:hypothetical protein
MFASYELRQEGPSLQPGPKVQNKGAKLSNALMRFQRRFVNGLVLHGKNRRDSDRSLAGRQLSYLLLIQPCLEFVRTHDLSRNFSVHNSMNKIVVSG